MKLIPTTNYNDIFINSNFKPNIYIIDKHECDSVFKNCSNGCSHDYAFLMSLADEETAIARFHYIQGIEDGYSYITKPEISSNKHTFKSDFVGPFFSLDECKYFAHMVYYKELVYYATSTLAEVEKGLLKLI